MTRKLEIGPGENPRAGYESIDIKDDPPCEWGRDPLPFPAGTFDEVYCSHVIEHVPWYQTHDALREAWRVLKPGGRIEIHTVDFAVVVGWYLKGRPGDRWTCGDRNAELDPMKWAAANIFAYERDDQQNWHRALFDAPYLRRCLEDAGFYDVETCPHPFGHHRGVNLGMRAVKP